MKKVVTLLANSRIHLPLYDWLIQTYGNLDGIQVFSLDAYLSRLIHKPSKDLIEILFIYKNLLKEALRQSTQENIFKDSIEDYDFLVACQRFLALCQAYGFDRFPKDTQKEKDLAVLLEVLNTYPLWQKAAHDLKLEDQSNVWILSDFSAPHHKPFIDRILEKGAHLAKVDELKEKKYWSASNIRKALELAAQEILEKEYDAQQILLVLADPKDQFVAEQIFRSHKIPYTFLNKKETNQVLEQFKLAFDYLIDPSQENLISLLRAVYPKTGMDVVQYLSLFEGESYLEGLRYEKNPFLSEGDFETLQSLEAQARSWQPILDQMSRWNSDSIPEIARMIQDQILEPTAEDIQAMDLVLNAWKNIRHELKGKKDLVLFRKYLDTLSADSVLEEMEGVLIGNKDALSFLRPIVFYIGADASNYPGSPVQRGLFDEAYLAKMDFPGLDERMKQNLEALESSLKQAETLYFIVAQSDYEGKNLDRPHDLDRFMGTLPEFHKVDDYHNYHIPDFSLSENTAASLFEKEGKRTFSVSSLNSFKDCPLQHFLRYGLHLHREHDAFNLRMDPSLLYEIYLQLNNQNPTAENIEAILQEKLNLPKQVFPAKSREFDRLARELSLKMENVLNNLSAFDQWGYQTYPVPARIDFENREANYSVSGSLSSPSATSFTLYDKTDPLDPLRMPSPQASFDIKLKDLPIDAKPYRVSYKSVHPAKSEPVPECALQEQYSANFLNQALVGHQLTENEAVPATIRKNKKSTYASRAEDLSRSALLLNEALGKPAVSALHDKKACTYCDFRAICRNGSKERE